jgi:hypothetical protein
MILNVFGDMIPFLIILFSYILLTPFIDIQSSKIDNPETLIEYYSQLKLIYLIGYGDFSSPADPAVTPLYRFISFFIHSIVIPLVLMNLLISVISHTYEVFNETSEE